MAKKKPVDTGNLYTFMNTMFALQDEGYLKDTLNTSHINANNYLTANNMFTGRYFKNAEDFIAERNKFYKICKTFNKMK